MLCLALTGAVFYALYYQGTNFTSSECLQNILTNLYLWSAILAIMGCFKKYCNRETALTRYMTKSSFGIYILHYPVLISACYVLHYFCKLPAIWNYLIALAAEFVMTFILYEVIIRIPIVRYCVLGVRRT